MDEEIKTGEMTGEIDESITVEEDFTLLEGKAVSITDDSDNKTNEDEVYEEALEIKESLDDIRQQIKDKLLDILEKGRITDADGCEIELLNDQYTEKYNELKDVANTVIPGGKGASTSTTNTSTTDTTEIVKVNIDYDEILKTINEKADWLYIDEDGTVMLNGEVVPKLKVVELEAEKIKADVGEFKNLTAENFQAVNAKIDNLEVGDLTAVNADITNLKALVAEIQTLVGGHLTMDNIQSLVLTSDKVTIANALIKDAMIANISASKINTGTINTNLVNIQSEDGSMIINGTTQQFKDSSGKVRIQIGKDAQGNFTFALFSQDGQGVLIDQTGIKSGAVPNGIIVNDMVADNANISGGKLDINSVITSINNGTEVIKGTRIQLDEQGQSLQVAFNQLKSKVETIENVTIDGDLSSVIEQVSSNTTNIGVMQGQISSLISNTTITKQDGQVVQLKDEFNSVKDTVTSHTQTINSLETNYKATLKTTTTEYYVSTSNTSQTGGSWSETSPTWSAGKYIWQRMKYTYTDNSVKYSTATCIQGAKGEQGSQGAKGQSLTKSTPQWYASTSNTTQTGGSWVESMPTIDSSHYLWLRYKLDWANPTATTYTTPTLEQIAESIKEVSAKQSEFQQDLDGFKWTVSNTYQTIDGMNDYATKSQLQQTATDLTATFNNGYNQGVTQMNADGIKVYHNQISGENYTHMSPAGFYIKYKGEDLLICDSNGLTYKGTITGSTIKGNECSIEDYLTVDTLRVGTIECSSLPKIVTASITLNVSTETAVGETNVYENGAYWDSLQACIDAIPSNLNGYTVSIQVLSDIREDVDIRGFSGGKLAIYMNSKTLYGNLFVRDNSARINVYGGNNTSAPTTNAKIKPSVPLDILDSGISVAGQATIYFSLNYVDVYCKTNSSNRSFYYAVASYDGSTCYFKGGKIIGSDNAFLVQSGARFYVASSTGKVNNYVFSAKSGGCMNVNNDTQCNSASSTKLYKATSAQIIISDSFNKWDGKTDDTGSNDNTTISTKTVTYKSNYGDTWRSTVYNSYKKDNTVREGDYGFGDCNGAWYFGNQFSELKGKTITKVTIKITRQSGGTHGDVTHTLVAHNDGARTSGMPSYISGYSQTFSMAVGDTKTITITNSTVLNAISAGTCKGFGLKSAYDKTHYSVCSGNATVTITYK